MNNNFIKNKDKIAFIWVTVLIGTVHVEKKFKVALKLLQIISFNFGKS